MVFVGSQSIVPQVILHPERGANSNSVSLNPNNPEVIDAPSYRDGIDNGIFIGYSQADLQWVISSSSFFIYDMDGFLDIFLTNGDGVEPFNNGPHQLFRNMGNGNHWLEVDLKGTISNPHGIGATVVIHTGGNIQIREQNAGIHSRSQNYQRLHFGLGDIDKVSLIQINWPSGIKQFKRDVDVDQIIVIREKREYEWWMVKFSETMCG